jgi:hypothetical protein
LGRRTRRLLLGMAGISMIAAIATPPAWGDVTLGQIGTPSGSICGFQEDWLQSSVSSGSSYVVPSTGGVSSWTVTSWSTSATGPSQLTMKFFRKVADPATYQVVTHDGPRSLVAGGASANTFPTNLQVESGDVLGFFTQTTDSCRSTSSGTVLFGSPGGTSGLADGQSGDFPGTTTGTLQVQAAITPTNTFRLRQTAFNRKKGNAILSFELPNPGTLRGSGHGTRVSLARTGPVGAVPAPGASPSALLVRARGTQRRKLEATGRVRVKLAVTYTPNGGTARTVPVKLKLRKKTWAARAGPRSAS